MAPRGCDAVEGGDPGHGGLLGLRNFQSYLFLCSCPRFTSSGTIAPWIRLTEAPVVGRRPPGCDGPVAAERNPLVMQICRYSRLFRALLPVFGLLFWLAPRPGLADGPADGS